MKVKVLVHIPPFETEVDVDHLDNTDEQKHQYARYIALERFVDKMACRELWCDSSELVVEVK